jgi:hypothetical protein
MPRKGITTMSKRVWEELDDDVDQEKDLISIVTNRTNMVNEHITVRYMHAMIGTRKITLLSQNDSDGSSACPICWTKGWLTEKQCLLDSAKTWDDSYDDSGRSQHEANTDRLANYE